MLALAHAAAVADAVAVRGDVAGAGMSRALSLEQLRLHVASLIRQHGGVRSAGRRLGVAPQTLCQFRDNTGGHFWPGPTLLKALGMVEEVQARYRRAE